MCCKCRYVPPSEYEKTGQERKRRMEEVGLLTAADKGVDVDCALLPYIMIWQ